MALLRARHTGLNTGQQSTDDLQRCIVDLVVSDSSTPFQLHRSQHFRPPRQIGTASARTDDDDLLDAQAKYYLQLNLFTSLISFIDLLYMFFPFPLDMLGGLVLPTYRSSVLRVQIFNLVLCSPPPRHARGLGRP
jgi:hypothetical protein